MTIYNLVGSVGPPKLASLAKLVMSASLYDVMSYTLQSASSSTYEMGPMPSAPYTVS